MLPMGSAQAHEKRMVGDHVLEVGWLQEPAFVGYPNAVSFTVAHGKEPAEGQFEVEIIFGVEDTDERTDPLPLEPVDESPGEYQAAIIPTRPGQYTFRVTGTLEDGDAVDESFTSSESTFDEVQDPAALQFPVQDPTTGELAEAVTRLTDRVEELRSGGDGGGSTALWIAIGSGVVALVAVALATRKRSTT
jgi:hypothetical protein